MVNVYTKKGIVYIICTFIFNEMSRLQYNLSIGCSTIWRKYGIIIGKLRMSIFVAMEMQKLYRLRPSIYAHNIMVKNKNWLSLVYTNMHE